MVQRDYLYQSKRNTNKFIEVRKYADGHYVWKQFINCTIPYLQRNYNGCSLKRSHLGVWRRANKLSRMALEDYDIVSVIERRVVK